MATNLDKLYNQLAADATLLGTLGVNGYAGLLQGGLYTRPLKETGPAATATAFYPGGVRCSAVLVDFGDVPHPQRDAVPHAYVQFVYVYFYAPATASGKADLDDARHRVFVLLDDWWFHTDDGPWAEVKFLNRRGVVESEAFPGAVEDYCRYQITSRYTNAV